MASENKRKSVRVQKPIDIAYSSNSPAMKGRIEDLSETGLFIDTPQPLTVGDELEFNFLLPDATPDAPIHGKGRVVWAEPHGGVGVEFTDLSDESRDRLRFFVATVYFLGEESIPDDSS